MQRKAKCEDMELLRVKLMHNRVFVMYEVILYFVLKESKTV